MLMKEFFEKVPPYKEEEIDDFNLTKYSPVKGNKPELNLFCDKCNGERFFETNSSYVFTENSRIVEYIYYCKNCDNSFKHFTILAQLLEEGDLSKGILMKIGEYPVFGQPIPSKVISLIGPDKDNFIKGKRCEEQGLGIGSYAYYRRVIETQKNRIIDQLIKICKQSNKYEKLIEQFEKAKKENQFSTAIGMIKQNLPDSLLIDGNNPLKLLHSALSKGVHELTDDECLERANIIRIVLTGLSKRINELLKEDTEWKNALTSLNKLNQE